MRANLFVSLILVLVGFSCLVAALGETQVLFFPKTPTTLLQNHAQQPFQVSSDEVNEGFVIASKPHNHVVPLLLDSKDDVAIHIAARTFANDVYRVTGVRPDIYNDTLPAGEDVKTAFIVGSASSDLIANVDGAGKPPGEWESYDVRVVQDPFSAGSSPSAALEHAIVAVGSDRRGTIYALYTLSEQMGVSPFHFWSDVPVKRHETVAFSSHLALSHGEPTVKYRGIFINDEHPALWGWAQQYFKREIWEAAFQTDFYEPWFEMMLRLKANYFWPAMYLSMFNVDGMPEVPKDPIPGPNSVLANDMGIVMGTSHHEPMDRHKPEWDRVKVGPWDWTNKDVLTKHWTYGAERGKGRDVLYTMGMRGDGDSPLTGASNELVENITATQQDILRDVYGDEFKNVPKMWAMYKEVADYYVEGLKVPEDISILFSDDNWGNIMSVMDPEKQHPGGAGIYYHVDYVGNPRAYKWINTINLAKTWEQMNIARAFNTTEIWILNVGTLKPLEMPTEHFLALAYDFDAWGRDSTKRFHEMWAAREFGDDVAEEVADIMMLYGRYASRTKPELLNSTMWSLINYNEAERVQTGWDDLETRAQKVYDNLPEETQPAFYELVLMLCSMQANINRLYIEAGRSNLYAMQGRNAANKHAHGAIDALYRDANLTNTFHSMLDSKWDHALDQSHINWITDDRLEADRDSLPPVSFVNPSLAIRPGIPMVELDIPHTFYTRLTVENSYGAWPGKNWWSCPEAMKCPDPTLYTMDPYGAKSRWMEIGAAGPKNIKWTARPDAEWLKVEPSNGKVMHDSSTDQRIKVSIDWTKVSKTTDGHIDLKTSDGGNLTITVPALVPPAPEDGFKGHVQGDGYVVIEAAHHTHAQAAHGHSWEEIPGYGRTLSGIEMFPIDASNFSVGTGPSVTYDIWTHQPGDAELNIQIGPTLNFISGKQISFGVQIDDEQPQEIQPVTMERLGGIPGRPGTEPVFVGAVPPDWENIVKSDIRNVTMPVSFEDAGKHSITLYGMTAGVVVERLSLDFGGIQERGYSYLGPPESYHV